MYDCYDHKCEICEETIPMHIDRASIRSVVFESFGDLNRGKEWKQ